MPFKTFTGELYSYRDARIRAPEAWKLNVVDLGYRNEAGQPVQREEWDRICAPGLGHFERDGKWWIYVEPCGYARRINENYGLPDPPPLPRMMSEWTECGCGKPHACGACGKPYFIEIHGCADGYCTYCYHAG